jgi:hypothetical protein
MGSLCRGGKGTDALIAATRHRLKDQQSQLERADPD